jgi:glycosyltransferase involved in cell wall biosynthesis
VLIFHGYLLRGTGSNVYNANLVAALARLGHEVHLLCQDRDPPVLVPPGAAGTVTLHRPEIGGLLPVYVHDAYEGFEVKTFPELTEAELDRYIELNVNAVVELAERLGGFDAALANHLVMAPSILRRAGLEYAIKVHGSDLSYAILPHLERFEPYAVEACEGASGILVGSGHIAERLRQAVDDPVTNAKVRLGPPGVDTDAFSPVPAGARSGRLAGLAGRLREVVPTASAGATTAWDRDAAAAADAVEWFAAAEGPRVVFVGKLIISKGVDLLLAAWPLVRAENPDARLLVVGFGAFDAGLRTIWAGLEAGDLGPLRAAALRGRGIEGGEEGELRMLSAFLAALPDGYERLAQEASGSVHFAGRLEHDEVGVLVPACDALVFPSTFPEAFGMVAAEAASAGALPVSASHSGAAEVSRELARELTPDVAALVSFALDDGAVSEIASRLNAWFSLGEPQRQEASEALRRAVVRLWSWEGVAAGVLSASSGDLGALPLPVTD